MTQLLAVDVGNTNVTLGVFSGKGLVATWRLATDARRTEDEYALLVDGALQRRGVDPGSLDAAAMCSTVPQVTDMMRHALAALVGDDLLVVGRGTRTGVNISYDRPQDVGADRIVDAVAVHYEYGGPAIIVDMGTATVFDAISRDGSYLGGAIAPGVRLAAEALYMGTSQLRRVELAPPETAIGRNTVASLRSGLVFGYVSLVEGMVQRFKAELGAEDARVVGTGGLVATIAPHTEAITVVDEALTLKGLRRLRELNG